MNVGHQRIRVTGAGAGSLSLQWEYLQSNVDVARRVLVDLEDRRVLFYIHGREDPEHCRISAADIRRLMTNELPNVSQGDNMDTALRAIRNSARDFIDAAGPESKRFVNDMGLFFDALEVMRAEMAPHIRSMATAYRIMIDHVLDENLPRYEMAATPVVG